MSASAYFMQECGICGRNLRIRVVYLGKEVVCQHCKSQFVACDPSSGILPLEDSGSAILQRADELLAAADEIKNRPR